MVVNPLQSTISTRFSPPKGFLWERPNPNTFRHFLVNFPLKPSGLPVRDFRNLPVAKQYHHVAILDIDVGEKDLQQ
ncbi:MAG: DUF4846 domain-containing protein, partial [Cruoricaptor ignavus]|nr:DUF4846 domain-containing protein [Cruoricaptor ignavus]